MASMKNVHNLSYAAVRCANCTLNALTMFVNMSANSAVYAMPT